MTEEKKSGPSRRDVLKYGAVTAAAAATGVVGTVAWTNRNKNNPAAPNATEQPVAPATPAEVDFENANVVDVRSLALLNRGTPRLRDGHMQFQVELLKEGANVMKLLPEQVYQFTNITTGDGKVLGVALPRNDGTVQVFELPRGAELQIAVVDRENNLIASTGNHPRNLIEGQDYNHLAAIAEVEQVRAARNANAVNYYTARYAGGLVGNYDAVFANNQFTRRDPAAPTRLNTMTTRLNWDSQAEIALREAAAAAPKR